MPTSSEPGAGRPSAPHRHAVLVTHESCGGPDDTGAVHGLLADRGFRVTRHSVFPHGEARDPDLALPDPGDADLVVLFGSFAHAWEERHHAWVAAEVDWVRRVLAHDVPYIGICFGGQILAAAWGGGIEPIGATELGMLTFPTRPDCPVPDGPWFTWHSDRAVLPPDAEVWARNDYGPQAFARGRAIGVQFHPEVTQELVESWIRTDEAALDAAYGAEKLRTEVAAAVGTSRANLSTFLDRVIAAWA
ncbi:type 1 glutamine amidotransferase [Streptomyces sp. NPDC001941]|uniref:type 1 glutamine amidotransferase n=1 Tax=Streptomyces sp. NPDC001941 TaxID=3154659 RepID=UPI00331B0F9E